MALTLSNEILAAALAGLEAQLAEIEEYIRQVRSLLGTAPKRRGRPAKSAAEKPAPPAAVNASRKRLGMSKAARKKLADAMRKRWAAAKKAGKTTIG